LLEDILRRISEDDDSKVSCREVLDMFAEKKRNRIESVRHGGDSQPRHENNNGGDTVNGIENEQDDDDDNLVNPDNTRIPGGKHDPNQPLKFEYDPKSKSIRKYIEV